tara:strand:+ start:1246 stop:1782 length:537 start_codon:yes stop_codon:yes gene_type:complete
MWLQVLPNAISDEDINKIISLKKKYPMEIGETQGGNTELRRAKVIYFNPDDELWVFNILGTIGEWANKLYNFDIERVETAQYAEYYDSNRGTYDWHIDSYPWGTVELQRKISIAIQLSDSNDYEGGDFILDVEPKSNFDIRKKGTAIIFPSYLRHTVKPVTKGERKSLVSWIQGVEFR